MKNLNYFGHPPVEGKVGGIIPSLFTAFVESRDETLLIPVVAGVIICGFSHDANAKHPRKIKANFVFIVLRF